jgi:ABC-type transporter Mla maintaining outer membrane lipid asymmetry ATPase subunit MlaF
VTHQIADAFEVTDHFIVLYNGAMVFDGSGAELLKSDQKHVQEFLAPFLDSVNALPKVVQGER